MCPCAHVWVELWLHVCVSMPASVLAAGCASTPQVWVAHLSVCGETWLPSTRTSPET